MSSIEETDDTFIKNVRGYFQDQQSLLLERDPRERGDNGMGVLALSFENIKYIFGMMINESIDDLPSF